MQGLWELEWIITTGTKIWYICSPSSQNAIQLLNLSNESEFHVNRKTSILYKSPIYLTYHEHIDICSSKRSCSFKQIQEKVLTGNGSEEYKNSRGNI